MNLEWGIALMVGERGSEKCGTGHSTDGGKMLQTARPRVGDYTEGQAS